MLDATIILQILWTSLATSSYYVLFAVAFALVLKVTRLFNFAQAAIMTVAFYTAFVAVQWLHWPAWAAFIAMMSTTLAASYGLERMGFEALRKRGVSVMFVFVFTCTMDSTLAPKNSLLPVWSPCVCVLMMVVIGLDVRFRMASSTGRPQSGSFVSTTTTPAVPMKTAVFPPPPFSTSLIVPTAIMAGDCHNLLLGRAPDRVSGMFMCFPFLR